MHKRKRNGNHRAIGDTRTNTERGVGYEHQKARREALASMPEGMPCSKCGLPMYKTQALDLDHVIPRALGGIGGPTRLTHASCNRSSGSRLGNAMQARRGRRPQRQKPRYPQW